MNVLHDEERAYTTAHAPGYTTPLWCLVTRGSLSLGYRTCPPHLGRRRTCPGGSEDRRKGWPGRSRWYLDPLGGAILFGRSSVFCQSNISYCGRKAWGEITQRIVEEVACCRLARYTSFYRLLPVRDEYLDGTDQSGDLPDLDAEPWYVGEESRRPGKANRVSKRANTNCS